MRTTRIALFALLGGLTLGACEDLQTLETAECPAAKGPFILETSRIDGAVTFDPPRNPLTRGDLIILDGTAHHLDGLAIREVRVGSVSAERLAFNFSSWRLQLTWEQLIGLATPNADGDIELAVEAADSCGKLYPFAKLTLPIDSDPNVRIDTLAVTVTYPEGIETLPADGHTQAVVAITATGRPAGARLVVKASRGTFQGFGTSAEIQLTSPFGDATTASAQLLFVAAQPGTVLVTVEVKNMVATASIVAVAGPDIAPASGRIQAGNTLAVTVSAGAALATCSARGDVGWTAHMDGEALDLRQTPIPESALDQRGRLSIEIAVSEDAAAASGLTISCQDVHGQQGTARFETDGGL